MSSILEVLINGDSSGLDKALKQSSTKLKDFGSKLKGVGTTLSVGLTAPLALAGGAAIKMASDYEESLNKVRVAFKDSAKDVEAFGKTSLKTFGIAEGTALDMAALFGDMATSMGASTSEASNLATSLVGLAGDLASFKNLNIEEVTTALNGVFTGETESLKRLGIVMTEVNLKQFAMEQGIRKQISAMTQAEKVNLRYQYVVANTANAQGDFARTSDGAANQMRIFTESMKELGQKFGEILLPVFTKIVTKINEWVDAFGDLSPTTKKIILLMAGIAAAIGPVLVALGSVMTAIGAIAPAFAAVVGLISAPLLAIVAAIAAIGYAVYDNWDAIKAYFTDLYDKSMLFRAGVNGVIAMLQNMWLVAKFVFGSFLKVVDAVYNGVKIAFSSIGKIIEGALTFDYNLIKEGISDALTGTIDNTKQLFIDLAGEAGQLAGQLAKNVSQAAQNTLNNRPLNIPISIGGSVNGENSANDGSESSNGLNGSFDPTPKLETVDTTAMGVKIGEIYDYATTVLTEKQAIFNEKMIGNLARAQEFNAGLTSIMQGGLQDLAGGIGQALGQAAASGGSAAQALTKVILSTVGSMATQLGQMAIGIGITLESIKKAFQSLSGPVAIAAGIALVALGAFITSSIPKIGAAKGGEAGNIKVPAFANGGIVSGPTTALVGEYAGAKSNPEVIAPLNKLKGMLSGQGANQQVQVTGEFMLRGQDLLVSLERAENEKNRIY